MIIRILSKIASFQKVLLDCYAAKEAHGAISFAIVSMITCVDANRLHLLQHLKHSVNNMCAYTVTSIKPVHTFATEAVFTLKNV